MQVLIVSDIFGRTPALEMIRKELLSESGPQIDIIDPYGGINPGFETEAMAYAAFMNQVGPVRYRSILADRIRKLTRRDINHFHDSDLEENTGDGAKAASGAGPQKSIENYPKDCRPVDTQMVLIGFSVGASAVWGISGEPFFKTVRKAICFYGSGIRDLTQVCPLSDVELVFPGHEPHFDVDTLIRALEPRKRVLIQKTGSGHGFMNRLSKNFNLSDYARFMAYLKAALRS